MRNFSSELLFSTSQKAEKANFRNIVYLAICYMALFAPYYAGLNLMTQVYRQLGFGDLGKICYFIIVTGSAIGNILASHIAKNRSPLLMIKFCAFLNVFFMAAGVLATYCSKNHADTGFCSRSFLYFINISTGFVSGVAQAFLWICQGVYLYSCTNRNNKGLFTGTFQAIFQACQIVSGLLSAVILGYTDQFVFYMILFIIMVTSVGMFKFTKPAVKYEDPKSQQEVSIHVTDTETLGEYLTKFKSVITDKKYKFLHQFAIFFGTGSAFIPVFLGTAVTIAMDTDDTALINRNTGFVVVVMAIGAITGSFILGKISDQYDDKMKLLNPTLVLFEAALIVTLLGCLFKSLTLVFICSFLWGCGEAGIMTIAWIIIGAKFNANPLLFAAFRFISKMSGVLIIMLTIVLPGFLWSLGIISATFLTFHFLVYQSKKQLEGKKSINDSLNCSLLVEMKVLNSQ